MQSIESDTKQSDNHVKSDSAGKLKIYNFNKFNIPESKKVASSIDKDYKLIDWRQAAALKAWHTRRGHGRPVIQVT